MSWVRFLGSRTIRHAQGGDRLATPTARQLLLPPSRHILLLRALVIPCYRPSPSCLDSLAGSCPHSYRSTAGLAAASLCLKGQDRLYEAGNSWYLAQQLCGLWPRQLWSLPTQFGLWPSNVCQPGAQCVPCSRLQAFGTLLKVVLTSTSFRHDGLLPVTTVPCTMSSPKAAKGGGKGP